MNNINILTNAIQYIEAHLSENIPSDDVAKSCFISLSSLQKLFRYCFDYSIKEYISKRRITIATRQLKETENNIIDIALNCGYNSPENFTRAFESMWGISPSEYRKNRKYMELFPKLKVTQKENTLAIYRESEGLCDVLLKNNGCFLICFDVVGLKKINQISRKNGDFVIIEAIDRINQIREENLLFRIGGDEFAMLVIGKELEYCEEIERALTDMNKVPIWLDGQPIPVILRIWIGKNHYSKSIDEYTQDLVYQVKHAWDN